jgi:NADH:ubiquinone reductase (H+-translocating)
MERKRVVIVGAGFAGLRAARAFRKQDVDVTVVDRHNYQTFQPLLYQVATAGLNAADVAFPVRGMLRRYPNLAFRYSTVVGIDHTANRVRLTDGELHFDYLVLAAGARASYFGIPGAAEHSFALYALPDATRLRNHLLRCFEATDPPGTSSGEGLLTFVVVGAGPTGVEMAGALTEVFEGVLAKDYRKVDRSHARVVLIEMQDVVLPPFTPKSQKHALEALRARGVEVRFGEKVASVGAGEIVLVSGERISTKTVIWAAGVRTAGLADMIGAEQTRGGRIVVRPDLSLPDRENVFVVGDIAAAVSPGGDIYPQVAQVAIQAGEHAGRQILRKIRGEGTVPFVYKDKGIMATIGRRSAVTELPSGIRISGTLGWLSWLFLHLLYLVGFRNRLSVLLNWAWSYLARERGPRLILETELDELGRTDEVSD